MTVVVVFVFSWGAHAIGYARGRDDADERRTSAVVAFAGLPKKWPEAELEPICADIDEGQTAKAVQPFQGVPMTADDLNAAIWIACNI